MRWRGNSYIREGGILPYQRCHATDFYPGPPHLFQSFTHEGRGYRAVVTSATLWGQSAGDGEPIDVVEAEIMTFYTEEGKVCLLPPDAKGIHCSIAIIRPTVHCRVGLIGEWIQGKVDFISHDNVMVTPVPLASIHCPLTITDIKDEFIVEVRLGDESFGQETMLIDFCYEHVDAEVPIVLCTEGLYGFSLDSPFWGGKPRYPFESTLLDAFILHNADDMGARIVINVFYDDMQEPMQKYSNRTDIVMRPGWELSELTYSGGWYDHEAMAEANCWWENRFRARWFQVISAADNFVLPIDVNVTLSSILSAVNYSIYSELQVPIVPVNAPERNIDNLHELNVLQRFSLLGKDIHTGQFTPIGNPRHFSYGMIHWLWYGRRPEAKSEMNSLEVVEKLRLHTVHVIALREHLRELVGSPNAWYGMLADRLQLRLKNQYLHQSHLTYTAPELISIGKSSTFFISLFALFAFSRLVCSLRLSFFFLKTNILFVFPVFYFIVSIFDETQPSRPFSEDRKIAHRSNPTR